jgi:hypothetical protein
MALEQFYTCERTLHKLRNGSLGELPEGFCQWLSNNGYCRWTIRKILGDIGHLNVYLGKISKAPRTEITAADINRFFKVYPSRCHHRGSLQKHVRRVRFLHDKSYIK